MNCQKNVKIIINWYSDYLTNNLPESALVEETAKDGEPAANSAEEPAEDNADQPQS